MSHLFAHQAMTAIINAQNRPLRHARAHKLLNAEVHHTLLPFQAEQHLDYSKIPLLDSHHDSAVVSPRLSLTHPIFSLQK